MLGGQVIAEISSSGTLQRGYVYLGGQLLAVQQSNAVSWVHQDPFVKSKRVTDGSGTVVSTIELDPWGGNTNRNNNSAFQPRAFTTYERDGNAADEAMFRRHNRWWSRFDQPDPYDGSYNLANPQSFNRYAYVQNDPVNFVDPSGSDTTFTWSPPETLPGPPANWTGVFGGGDTGITIFDPFINEGGWVDITSVPLGNLQQALEDLLNKKDCADYVQKLLNEANRLFGSSYPHIGTIREGFKRISSSGGYQLDSVASNGGTVTGDLFANGASLGTVHITPYRTIGRVPSAREIKSAQARYAYVAETLRVFQGEVLDISYFPSASDAYLRCSPKRKPLRQYRKK